MAGRRCRAASAIISLLFAKVTTFGAMIRPLSGSPAGRDVGAVWSLRCDYAKRRERNDSSAMLIEPPQYLIRRAAHRRMMQRAQARLVGDEACIVREHAWPRSFNSLLPD